MDYDAEFRQDAIERTPEMFRRLCEGLRQYTVSHPGEGLTPKDEPGSFPIWDIVAMVEETRVAKAA